MSQDAIEVIEFDIRGQICPSTLLIALREINRHQGALRQGRMRLSFVTDNRDSTATIPDAVRNMGYEVAVTRESGYYRMAISRPES